jgi:hypothetical protein
MGLQIPREHKVVHMVLDSIPRAHWILRSYSEHSKGHRNRRAEPRIIGPEWPIGAEGQAHLDSSARVRLLVRDVTNIGEAESSPSCPLHNRMQAPENAQMQAFWKT